MIHLPNSFLVLYGVGDILYVLSENTRWGLLDGKFVVWCDAIFFHISFGLVGYFIYFCLSCFNYCHYLKRNL